MADGPLTPEEFAGLMAPLGPFEPAPRLAVGVSGGADSLALALLADTWARQRGGAAMALIVNHGLRAEAASEAEMAAAVLVARGIPARILTAHGLAPGPGAAERARARRYELLCAACRERGLLHLLLAHHAADQAETLLLRTLSRSGAWGLAGMAGLAERRCVRLLRPLLSVPPIRLRAAVTASGLGWTEDPSNRDIRASRPRLRALRADRDGTGSATWALVEAARAHGVARARAEAEVAVWLARHVALYAEGFALLPDAPIPLYALGALIAALSGASYPPRTRGLASLAAAPRPATLGGIRMLPAGRIGGGQLLMVREAQAQAPAVPARPGAAWDRRFRLAPWAEPPEGATMGALGERASALRRHSRLPAAVLRALPAICVGERLVAVPHLDWPDAAAARRCPILFSPARAAAGAPFVPTS